MPKRPRSHKLEDQSRNELHRIFTDFGWTVENLAKDYGEDLLVRIFSRGSATPYSFFVQAKATNRSLAYLATDKRNFLYPISSNHVKHWERFWEPVIITLWDGQNRSTYWECIQSFCEAPWPLGPPNLSRKTLRVRIPTDHVLDPEGLRTIEARTKSRFERFTRERDGAKILVEILKDKLGLEVEYDPHGGILLIPKGTFVKDSVGGTSASFFGRTAARLEDIRRRLGCTFEEAFQSCLDVATLIATGYKATGKLGLYDHDGNAIVSWESLEALAVSARKHADV